MAITGGGRGIGRAIAEALAREGARVAVGDLDGELAERTAATLGAGGLGLRVDVTDHAALIAFLDEVEARLGPLDVLVDDAGIMAVTPLAEESAESIARQLELDLGAVIHGTQEAIRRMVPRGTGHIVNIASLAGRGATPSLATYCATKHGVVGLSEAVRLELRGTGVDVSVAMPYFVRTELATGVADSRGVRQVSPEEVAAEGCRRSGTRGSTSSCRARRPGWSGSGPSCRGAPARRSPTRSSSIRWRCTPTARHGPAVRRARPPARPRPTTSAQPSSRRASRR